MKNWSHLFNISQSDINIMAERYFKEVMQDICARAELILKYYDNLLNARHLLKKITAEYDDCWRLYSLAPPDQRWALMMLLEKINKQKKELVNIINYHPLYRTKKKSYSFNISDIKRHARVADVIGRQPAYRSETRDKYLCPFHKEKTASFTVYKKDDGDQFYCFGCGKNGDVIDLVMIMEQCKFTEACLLLIT